MNKNEFAIYEKNGDIYSIGMKFDNLLRQNNLPAMIGGGKNNLHSSSLGLPVGLSLIKNQMNNDEDDMPIHDLYDKTLEGGVINENIYSKLLHLAEQRNITNSKTRKRRRKKKRQTRRLY